MRMLAEQSGMEWQVFTYSLGHTNTRVADGKSLALLVWDNVDTEVFARVELTRVGKSLISDLV